MNYDEGNNQQVNDTDFPSISMTPCYNVLRTCRTFMEDHDNENPIVTINSNALQRLGETIAPQIVNSQTNNDANARKENESNNDNNNKTKEDWAAWDEEGWHYTATNFKGSLEERKERITLYILALDAINFCFWPHPLSTTSMSCSSQPEQLENNTLEYDHLAIALRKLAEQDETLKEDEKKAEGRVPSLSSSSSYFFSPQNLSTMTVSKFENAIKPFLQNHSIPNMKERVRLWNELGYGLLTHFQGRAMNLITKSKRHGPTCVSLIISTFPGFRDESICPMTGKWICFYKRAQIAVGDLRQALGEVQKDDTVCAWTGMDELTTFADYRVPQLLRHVGVLEYGSTLGAKVDQGIEIPCNSMEELSIRASTVVAVDSLVSVVRTILKKQQTTCEENKEIFEKVTAVTLDWHLWQEGEKLQQQGQMNPHHKTRTIFY